MATQEIYNIENRSSLILKRKRKLMGAFLKSNDTKYKIRCHLMIKDLTYQYDCLEMILFEMYDKELRRLIPEAKNNYKVEIDCLDLHLNDLECAKTLCLVTHNFHGATKISQLIRMQYEVNKLIVK